MPQHGRLTHTLFLAVLLFPLASCAAIPREQVRSTGSLTPPLVCARTAPAPPADRFRVGPNGGLLRVGGNELRIPKNALSREVIVTFGENPSDTVGVTLDTENVQFEHPVELVISMQRCTDPGTAWSIWRIRPQTAPEELETRITGRIARTWFQQHSGFIVASRTP